MHLRGGEKRTPAQATARWSKAPIHEDIAGISETLSGGAKAEKLSAISRLSQALDSSGGTWGLGDTVTALLCQALGDNDRDVCRSAILALAIDSPRTMNGLRLGLSNNHAEVRRLSAAMINLALLKEPGLLRSGFGYGEDEREMARRLSSCLGDSNGMVRSESRAALEKLAQRSPIAVLEALDYMEAKGFASGSDGIAKRSIDAIRAGIETAIAGLAGMARA
jgi:hypothetical protein